MSDFIRKDMKKWYPELYLESRVKIVEVGKELLSTFGKDIQKYVRKHFLKNNVEVITELGVKEVRRNELG